MRKAALIPMLMVGGCISNHPAVRPLRPLEIPLAPYRDVATAAHEGTLMYEGGCLLLRDERTRALFMPVWPFGSSFNGTALLVHVPGKTDQRIMVAEEVLVRGEADPWATLGGAVYRPFQNQCRGYEPFLVSSVRPSD